MNTGDGFESYDAYIASSDKIITQALIQHLQNADGPNNAPFHLGWANFYQSELDRRKQNKTTNTFIRLTKANLILTIISTITAITAICVTFHCKP